MDTEQVARICHETNRTYCFSIGDMSQLPWEQAPEWQRASTRVGIKFHLSRLQLGQEVPPSASHESWLQQKADEGWKYGPVKDADKKEHPCFLPYHNLPLEQRMKDYLFGAIVAAFYAAEAKTKVVR